MMANNISIILTATIDVKGISHMERSDAHVRLADYKGALISWLRNPAVDSIVFVENSGYDLNELREIVANHDKCKISVEFLSFDGQDFPRNLGKGYGEMIALQYAVKHSEILAKTRKFIKVNGRYYVPNIDKIINYFSTYSDLDVMCDFSRRISWSDSRVFAGNFRFLNDYLCSTLDLINDSVGVNFEHVLARAAHRAIADGRNWSLLPCVPRLQGIYATGNIPYKNSIHRMLAKELFYWVKRLVISR